jgi:hypothetical protein
MGALAAAAQKTVAMDHTPQNFWLSLELSPDNPASFPSSSNPSLASQRKPDYPARFDGPDQPLYQLLSYHTWLPHGQATCYKRY